jgi:hypothetical protein
MRLIGAFFARIPVKARKIADAALTFLEAFSM